MKVKVAKWGNSLGVRLPKAAAEAAGLKPGAVLDVVVEGGNITLKAAPRKPLPRYRLEDMVAEMKRLGGAAAAPETVEWGPDVGSEIIDDAYSHGEITLDDILNGKMPADAGDIAWIEFDPVLGTEQAGRRPGLILTALIYHEQSPRAVVCPITSNTREWPFNVPLPNGLHVTGVVLVDQIRTVDRAHRIFDVIDRAPQELVDDVRAKLATLLEIDVGDFSAGPEGM